MLKTLAFLVFVVAGAETASCGPHVIVSIKESSPDLITVRNASSPGWSVGRLEIDLSPSAGGVYVDYGLDGESVDPFISGRSGAIKVEQILGADGGSRKLGLVFSKFDAPDTFHMHIDFDNERDTREFGRDYIDPHEISGALFTATLIHDSGSKTSATGTIGADGAGSIGGGGCV